MQHSRPTGLVVIATILGLIGSVTLLVHAALPFGRTPMSELDPVLVLFGLAYGFLAVFAAWKLWRLSPSGPEAFLAWCASIVAFNLYLSRSIPEFGSPWLIPSYALATLLIVWGYRYTRRVCRPAA